MPRLRSLPEQPVMRDLYKSQPATCKPLGELTEVAMRGPSPFTQGQRELIAAYVSGLNACTYCHATLWRIGHRFFLSSRRDFRQHDYRGAAAFYDAPAMIGNDDPSILLSAASRGSSC